MNRLLVKRSLVFRMLFELLDIPDSYYQKAAARHDSLGRWFLREGSLLAGFRPSVYPQGSFRLGTVIRPLFDHEYYDLDTVCELMGLTKLGVTQKQLKAWVGIEVKAYAKAHNFNDPVEETKRCWRLPYADEVNFHLDVLPCIPEDQNVIRLLMAHGVNPALAKLATALTCNEHRNYAILSSDWPTTNPAGYGLWFEDRMRTVAASKRQQLVEEGFYASVEQVPAYALKTPLQRAIQILKRHRDVMFKDAPELKPISMIITTLAALAYAGEDDVEDALEGILQRMPTFVQQQKPRVANPTNPGEDFANKWETNPELEDDFWLWHSQAVTDLSVLRTTSDPSRFRNLMESRFQLSINETQARSVLGHSPIVSVAAPAIHIASSTAPRPWGT